MKLYDLPQGAKIKAECFNDEGKKIGDMITFHHIDGMYSYCTVDGVEENNVIHLSSGTPLQKVDDYYVIAE